MTVTTACCCAVATIVLTPRVATTTFGTATAATSHPPPSTPSKNPYAGGPSTCPRSCRHARNVGKILDVHLGLPLAAGRVTLRSPTAAIQIGGNIELLEITPATCRP